MESEMLFVDIYLNFTEYGVLNTFNISFTSNIK